MKRRNVLTISLAAVGLAACGGGGGGSERPRRALFGDSLAWGAAGLGRLAVPPAVRLGADDYSQGGMTLTQAFGGTVPGADQRMPFPVWPAGLLARPADVAVMWFGGASALLGEPVEVHEARYLQAVQAAQSVGMRVVMVGTYARFAAYDWASARVAAATGATWVDLAARWPEPELIDPHHATQAQSDLWCAAVDEAAP